MCGIVGYTGYRQAYGIVIDGLQKLEYRGYDSAGVALHKGEQIDVYKKTGKVATWKSLYTTKIYSRLQG